jgi:hypothetical protein
LQLNGTFRLFIRAAQKEPAAYVRIFERALSGLRDSIGATTLESFVVGLDTICWDGEKEGEETGLQDVDKLGDLWAVSLIMRLSGLILLFGCQAMSSHAELKNIGVSDFSAEHLRRLLSLVDSRNSSGEDSKTPAKLLRKPTINQLNLSPSAAEPSALLELTRREDINLQTHVDDLGGFSYFVCCLAC